MISGVTILSNVDLLSFVDILLVLVIKLGQQNKHVMGAIFKII